MPPRKQILTPTDAVLRRKKKAIHRLHVDVRIVRLHAVRVHHALRLTVMQNTPIGTQTIPPDAGTRETATANHADKTDRRIFKDRKQIVNNILIDDKHILMQIDFVFCVGGTRPFVVTRTHGSSIAYRNVFD